MLDQLLTPIDLADFFANYYEQKHLLIRRNDPNYFSHLLSYQKLDELLFSTDLHHPQLRIVNNATEKFPDPKTYTVKNSTRIDPLKFLRHYRQGSTMVFSAAHERIFSLRQLTNQIGAYLQHPLQTNIYLTPHNAQGFAPHYDTHDVFVLQFAGSKRWRIYDTNQLLADKTTPFDKENCAVGKVIAEFTLHQGDSLYIPRGIMHDANCVDENSGHITLGLVAKTWAVTLAELLLDVSKDHTILRRFPKFHQDASIDQEAEQLSELLLKLIASVNDHSEIAHDFFSKQRQISSGLLQQTVATKTVQPSSEIALYDPNNTRIIPNGEVVEVYHYDVKVSLPKACHNFLSQLKKADGYTSIYALTCELTTEEKVLLAEELQTVGLLKIRIPQQPRENHKPVWQTNQVQVY